MTKCIAEPLGRKDIRKLAELIRIVEGSHDQLFFDIVHFTYWSQIYEIKNGLL